MKGVALEKGPMLRQLFRLPCRLCPGSKSPLPVLPGTLGMTWYFGYGGKILMVVVVKT